MSFFFATMLPKTSKYQMLRAIGNIRPSISMMTCGILVLCTVILVLITEYTKQWQRQHQKPNEKQKTTLFLIQAIAGTIFCISFYYLCIGGLTYFQALQHGMYQDNLTWNEILDSTELSPREDKLPENTDELTNAIILYYKFGCEDCEAVYQQESEFFSDIDNVYWISTRSKQGQNLLNTYPVTQVPSGVYITDSTAGVTLPLYQKTTESVEFHETNAETLLNLYNTANN